MRCQALACVIFGLLAACSDDGQTTGGGGSGAGTGDGGGASSADGGGGSTSTAPEGGGGATSDGGGDTGGGGGGSGGASPVTCEGKTGVAGDTDYTLDWDGDMRTFRVHAPPSYDPASGTQVVMVFHGYFEDGDQIETISKMTPETDARGAIVVYADGRSMGWNAGSCCGSSSTLGVDDVGFVLAMLDQIEADYCVDVRRVFSAGFSAGGMLSHRLACEAADRIAAIGPVSGTLAIDTCTPSRPVPVMHFHGTADGVVAYDGGGFADARSVPDTIAAWVANDECDPTAAVTFDEGAATCETYTGCAMGAEVVLCSLEGAGHQWPGGESAGPGGEINMDIFASTAMLDFFDNHPMP